MLQTESALQMLELLSCENTMRHVEVLLLSQSPVRVVTNLLIFENRTKDCTCAELCRMGCSEARVRSIEVLVTLLSWACAGCGPLCTEWLGCEAASRGWLLKLAVCRE